MRPDLLSSPLLVSSVVLLLANDWIFKPIFHNWLTGKVSDFSGLVAITLFGCAVFPKKRWLVASLVSFTFVYWKSPYSQSFIQLLNYLAPFPVGRTIDYTDLMALPAVWVASHLALRMRGLSARAWMQQIFASVSLIAFTATSYINTHMVRENADILASSNGRLSKTAEYDLQQLLDAIAVRYELTCSVCEPLSSGRLYGGGWPSGFSFVARLDLEQGRLLYDIRSTDINREPSRQKDVDSLRDELTKELRVRFPSLKIDTATLPRRDSIRLAVYKTKSLTSYRDPENQRDFERAKVLISETAAKFGMKHEQSLNVFYLGALLGPNPYDREITISIGIADSPLVIINVYRNSDEFSETQKLIAKDVERRLQAEFGTDRAGLR
jgi:hypothetical protein